MRTIIDIPLEQKKALQSISKKRGLSMAEVIRRALTSYLESLSTESSENKSFGLWQKRNIDGLSYQNKIRDEWVK